MARRGTRVTRNLTVAAIVFAAMALTAASASGATTRAAWVAQVDPICQNAQGQEVVAAQPLLRATKRAKKHARSRKVERTFSRAFRTYFGQYVSIERAATAQIATIPPATEDVSLVQVWLRARGELLDSETQLFFGGFKPKKGLKGLAQVFTAFFQLIGREQEVTDLVRDFGFHYCSQPQEDPGAGIADISPK